jgi:MFS family permease
MVLAIMVSMVAFLDSNIANLALPATERDLGGGLPLQQWVLDGYLLALAAMILPGGSISDLFGRVPVLRFGLAAEGPAEIGERVGPVVLGSVLAPRHRQLRRTASTWRLTASGGPPTAESRDEGDRPAGAPHGVVRYRSA